jgi:uncharacterized protein
MAADVGDRWQRNNLDTATSPYLRQHRSNPVWWQSWSQETIDHARALDLPLFVSVGYATCHWCHVMASEAFSDQAAADYLNRHFVAIKVDREERPEIDHFLMQFLLVTRGQGGWPLNAFLTPDMKPMLALTYVPIAARGGMPGFVTVLEKVTEFFRTDRHRLQPFDLWKGVSPEAPLEGEEADDAALHRARNLLRRVDREHGGFGGETKFPPHGSMLFLLYLLSIHSRDSKPLPMLQEIDQTVRMTLHAMAQRGLHDHLQGGFFRYCTDRAWTIPHFEKMLYDQAMLLWVYALAWKVLGEPWYRQVAERIVLCLEESFRSPVGPYASALDADTDHREGGTYLWRPEELPPRARELFHVESEIGAVDGLRHLIRRDPGELSDSDLAVLQELLLRRRLRPQPDSDEKFVTAWNALAAISLVHAGRFLGRPDLLRRAEEVYDDLCRYNRDDAGRWNRSSLAGARNGTECLEDYGAVLVLLTLFVEESTDSARRDRWIREARLVADRIELFRRPPGWRYTLSGDAPDVPADTVDSPTPSPVALAEMGLARLALIQGQPAEALAFGAEQARDFHNLATLLARGEFYLLESPRPISWSRLPAHSIRTLAEHETWCFRGTCRPGALPDLS